MAVTYDKYYEAENLFGNPYPELIEFFAEYSKKGKILDLGCGQGRDSIPLARIGYNVTGIDNSKVGIEQMNRIAEAESLTLTGKVTDIFEFDNFVGYDFILLDSMFHFAKNDRKKETDFIKRILSKIKNGCLVIFCVQDTGKKIEILNKTIDFEKQLNRVIDTKFEYIFEDKENGHKSKTDYRMVVVEK
jgi:2-polyprenyl-3-methyl-5-hydroxy-6-metoxy-1,4-benzoquinol methylase